MASSQNKTIPTKVTPKSFIESLEVTPEMKKDVSGLVKFYEKVTGEKCVMWGKIFGFGSYHYVYDSGRQGDSLACGFAVRSVGIMIYTMMGHAAYPELLKKLGKYKDSGKSCLMIKKVSDIDLNVLEKLIKSSVADLKKKYKVSK